MRRHAARFALLCLPVLLAACAGGGTRTAERRLSPEVAAMYAEVPDGEIIIPAVKPQWLPDRNVRAEVPYWGPERPGTIVVDPHAKYLYHVLPDHRAVRYAIAVGKEGLGFSGSANVAYTREWPRWTPTANMLRREPELYGPWRGGMEGGLDNPLGARALYLYRNGKDTRFRIHGTAYPWSIGGEDTAGCIRLYNQDIIHLEQVVQPGARVIVLRESESGRGTVPPENLSDGALLPPPAG